MGEPCFLRRFIPGTHFVQDIDSRQGGALVLFYNYGKTVVKRPFLKMNHFLVLTQFKYIVHTIHMATIPLTKMHSE